MLQSKFHADARILLPSKVKNFVELLLLNTAVFQDGKYQRAAKNLIAMAFLPVHPVENSSAHVSFLHCC